MSEFERYFPEMPSGYDAWKTTDRYAEELNDAFDEDPDYNDERSDGDLDDEGVRYGHAAVGPYAGWASKYDRDWDDDGSR